MTPNPILDISKEDKTKETVGAAAHRLLSNPDEKQGVVDTQREIDKTFLEEVAKCIKRYPEWKNPWYVVLLVKKDIPQAPNVVSKKWYGYDKLPKPICDQTVWRYYPESYNLEFLWTIPDIETTIRMYKYPMSFPEDHCQLIKFVFDFMEDKLYGIYREKFKDGL